MDPQYRIHYLGWNTDDGHDKVWGWFTLSSDSNTYYNFWGRRGAKLTWKEYTGRSGSDTLYDLRDQKARKGYRSVPIEQIDQITPGFIESFERNFTLARLFDNFHLKHKEEA